MKVKNLYVGNIDFMFHQSRIQKIIFVKQVPKFTQAVRSLLGAPNPLFTDAFTKLDYELKFNQVIPLSFFLYEKNAKTDISKNELKVVYKKKKKEMENIFNAENRKIGF